MPKQDWETSESGNWNVAADFTKLKVMKPLYECDIYEEVATFGTTDLWSEMVDFDDNPNMKNTARIKGIRRLLKTLSLLVSNTQFAVKKGDKPKMQKFKEDLENVKKVLPYIESKTFNQRDKTTTVVIDEEIFQKLLDILINIKADINEPLNRADLIFTHRDEFDADKYKQSIKDRFIRGE